MIVRFCELNEHSCVFFFLITWIYRYSCYLVLSPSGVVNNETGNFSGMQIYFSPSCIRCYLLLVNYSVWDMFIL
jgi:hypothetical protein